MNYRNLGQTGLKVSELCLGTMQFGWTATEEESFTVLDAAFEAGINFIDTADIYSRWVPGNPGGVSEEIVGRWMQRSGAPRSRLVIASKVRGRMGEGPNDEGLSRAHIFDAVHASLRRLNTDYIDLYQTHWEDENTPIEETLSALDMLVRQGKVRYVGCSNIPAWRLTEAIWVAHQHDWIRYDSLQPHYNLVHRAEFERELAGVCHAYGVGVIPYSPLAGGFLSGKYRREQAAESARKRSAERYMTEENFTLLDKLDEISQATQHSPAQIALAWLLADPLITSPIIGPRNLEQLADNLGGAGQWLSPQDKQALDEATAWKD